MPRMNKSRFALLGLLTLGEMSGYELKKVFEQSLIHFWSESYGQIYPMLRKLSEEGLVRGRTEKTGGKPARTVYALTEDGRRVLRNWLGDPVEAHRERNELLLKLFFGRQSAPAVNRRHVEAFRERRRNTLQAYEQIERWLTTEGRDAEDLPYWLLTLSQGQHVTRALIAWCDETLRVLENGQDNTPAGSVTP